MRISDWSSDVCSSDLANDQSAAHVSFRSGKKLAHAVLCVSYVACARQCPVSMRHYRVCRKWRRGDSFGRRQQHWRNHPIVPGKTYLPRPVRSEEHTSELQSLMRISYAVFCLKKKTHTKKHNTPTHTDILHTL